jgi:hypothetical protein
MCEDLHRNPISQNHQIAGDDFTGNSAFMFAIISLKRTNKLNNREAVHSFVKTIRFSYPKSICTIPKQRQNSRDGLEKKLGRHGRASTPNTT